MKKITHVAGEHTDEIIENILCNSYTLSKAKINIKMAELEDMTTELTNALKEKEKTKAKKCNVYLRIEKTQSDDRDRVRRTNLLG